MTFSIVVLSTRIALSFTWICMPFFVSRQNNDLCLLLRNQSNVLASNSLPSRVFLSFFNKHCSSQNVPRFYLYIIFFHFFLSICCKDWHLLNFSFKSNYLNKYWTILNIVYLHVYLLQNEQLLLKNNFNLISIVTGTVLLFTFSIKSDWIFFVFVQWIYIRLVWSGNNLK